MAPIRRSSIVLGNLVAALAITALQIVVLIVLSALRGAAYPTGLHVLWFLGAPLVFSILMYSVAEILAVQLPSAEAYTGRCWWWPSCRSSLPGRPHHRAARVGLDAVAKVLPLTHALALFRYGLTSHGGSVALHYIWGMKSAASMAALSMGVIAVYTVVALRGAVRLFATAGTS